MKEETYDPVVTTRATWARRISWQAIFGGIIVALAMELLLTVLGASVGGTIGMQNQQDDATGHAVGIGFGIWFIIVSIISLYLGGWVAGRMSGLTRSNEGALHGFVTWGAVTLLSVYLVSATAGSVLSMTTHLLGQVMPLDNQTAGQLTGANPQGGAGTSMQESATGGSASVQREVRSIEQKTGPSSQLSAAVDRMFSHQGNIDPADHDAVVNALVNEGKMSRDDANRTVDRWIQERQGKGAAVSQQLQDAGKTLGRGLTVTGWWSFIVLVLGAIAAVLGGSNGASAFLRTRPEATVAA